MSSTSFHYKYDIPNRDNLSEAGNASSSTKRLLTKLGVDPYAIKKVSISMYEAEINAVIHANGGTADINIDDEKVVIKIIDNGPGIPDIDLAMTEGYSTATDAVREMGFGAGMGMPNIKKYADEMYIDTCIDRGTTITIIVRLKG